MLHLTATRECPKDKYFTCTNQRCIRHTDRCNGYDDCGDLTDEFNCTQKCDPLTHFQCNDKTSCIPLVKLCDGQYMDYSSIFVQKALFLKKS